METASDHAFKPPRAVAGIKELNYELFKQEVTIPAFVAIPKSIGFILKKFQNYLLRLESFKHVVACPFDEKKKLILLSPGVSLEASFPEEELRLIKDHSIQFVSHKIKLTYDNYSKEDVLKSILPDTLGDITTAFETVGHIAHMNLRDKELEYKNIIGQVILDKTPAIRTVVNKTNTIDTTYRHFKMELLAGADEMNATVNEHGCTFRFDFSKVFWNSRLQLEHKRLTDIVKTADTVYDVFAGVGPFAVPVAKKGCFVFANDLNPFSYEALNVNAKLNKVEKKIRTFNLDGHEFIRMLIKREGPQDNTDCQSGEKTLDGKQEEVLCGEGQCHVVMNLPATAIDFLQGFSYQQRPSKDVTSDVVNHSSVTNKDITIHCYCFSKSDSPFEDAQSRIEETINGKLISGKSKFHLVRDVAPKKVMVCVSFLLPWSLEHCKVFQEEIKNRPDGRLRGVKRSHEDSDQDEKEN